MCIEIAIASPLFIRTGLELFLLALQNPIYKFNLVVEPCNTSQGTGEAGLNPEGQLTFYELHPECSSND